MIMSAEARYQDRAGSEHEQVHSAPHYAALCGAEGDLLNLT